MKNSACNTPWSQFIFFGAVFVLTAAFDFLYAQDALSFGRGGAAAAVPSRASAALWNPAQLALSQNVKQFRWLEGGFSAQDATNTDQALLDFDLAKLMPPPHAIRRFQSYQGWSGFQFRNYVFGALYQQTLAEEYTPDYPLFLQDRSDGSLTAGSSFQLGADRSFSRVNTILLGYGAPLPAQQFSFLSAGANIQFHSGMLLRETHQDAKLTAGSGTGAPKTLFEARNGRGISYDAALFAQVNRSLALGFLWENLSSEMKWDAVKTEGLVNDQTGEFQSLSRTEVQIERPFDRAFHFGVFWTPPGGAGGLTAQSVRSRGKTKWRFGYEAVDPKSGLAYRIGTFHETASDKRVWSFGGSWLTRSFGAHVAFLTRKFPNLTDSPMIGGAFGLFYTW